MKAIHIRLYVFVPSSCIAALLSLGPLYLTLAEPVVTIARASFSKMSRRQHFFSSARSTDQNFHYVLERGPGEECKDAICFYQALPGPGLAISLRGPRGRLNAPFFLFFQFIYSYGRTYSQNIICPRCNA